jgi:hypothetical protein
VSKLAYFAHLAWSHGRARGILAGRPAYEARELLANRLRGAVSRAGNVAGWGDEFFGRRGVGAKLEALRLDDAVWWRSVKADPSGALWRTLRGQGGQTETLTAAALLPDWLYARLPNDTDANTDDTP